MAKKKDAIVVAEDSELQAYDVLAEGVEAISEVIQANVGGMSDLGEFSLPRAVNPSGQSKSWMIPGLGDDEEHVSEVEGIIVLHKNARVFYEQPYEETGGGNQPDCSSIDGIKGEGMPGGLCPKCPLAKFSKGDDGVTVRPQCREMKRIFILRPGEIMPTMFNATGANVSQVQNYLFNLSVKGRLKFNHCITKVKIELDKYKNGNAWHKWNLSLVAKLPPGTAEQMDMFHEFLEPIVNKIALTVDEVAEEDDSSVPY